MLDVSAENLWLEVQAAVNFRDSHLTRVSELIGYYTGAAYNGQGGDWPENHMFEYIRLNTAKIVFDNPRVRSKTTRPTQRPIARAIQHGLNRNARETKMRRLLKRIFVGQSFCYQAVLNSVEPQRWFDARTNKTYHWPTSYTLDRHRFFFDPLCQVYGYARYAGHMWIRDKEDLLREAKAGRGGWDAEAIEAMSADEGIESLPEREGVHRAELRRDEIVGYDIWVPEIDMGDPAKGFNGTIYTIAYGGGPNDPHAAELRAPRAYFGPRWGPYTLFGVYPVPGDPYPLAPFIANFPQMVELNAIATAANVAVKKYKRLILCSAENNDLIKKLKAGKNLFVFPVKGFKKEQVIQLELAGITDQHVKQLQIAMERMDRNSGIDDPGRGKSGSRSTATEIAVADEARKDSVAYVQQEFTDATIEMLETRGYFLYHDDRVAYPLGEDAADDMGMGEPWFEGGSGPQDEYAYDDIELELEPYSMERMSEALGRASYREQMELALQAAPLIPTTPFYDWKKLFEKGGHVNNDPYFSEFFLPEIARMVGMMATQQDSVGAVGGGVGDGIASTSPPSTSGTMKGNLLAQVASP